jgi:NADH-quinone oxidoreductase subunit M
MSPIWTILLIVIPLLGALLVAFDREEGAYQSAMRTMLFTLVPGLFMLYQFNYSMGSEYQGAASISWISDLGLKLSIGTDAIALLLIALTVLLGPIVVAASKTAITEDRRKYYAWLLVLQSAMVGVFAARDLMLFYICFEFTLLPMFVLIRCYGSTNRVAASTKFFLYTFTGSMMTLAGLMYVVYFVAQETGIWTLDIATITAIAPRMPLEHQAWVLFAMLAGFAVKVPLFPVHTWLPLAHTEAPTAGSVILAGVLLKLGTYGLLRFAIPVTPAAFIEYAPFIATLSVIGIIYAGLICWVQEDIKKLVAYSSVSHLGFCVLGLAALNVSGLSGSVLYMLSHGLSTGGLFLMIGFMYERYHTRDMRQVGGLASKMPVWSFFMVFFAMASVGLPGLNGFPSEVLCLIAAFQSDAAWTAAHEAGAWGTTLGPWFAVFAGTGMVIAAMYLLYMVGKICFGAYREPEGHHAHEVLPTDLSRREIWTLIPLAVGCLVFGLRPVYLLDAVSDPINDTVIAAYENQHHELHIETNEEHAMTEHSTSEQQP